MGKNNKNLATSYFFARMSAYQSVAALVDLCGLTLSRAAYKTDALVQERGFVQSSG